MATAVKAIQKVLRIFNLRNNLSSGSCEHGMLKLAFASLVSIRDDDLFMNIQLAFWHKTTSPRRLSCSYAFFAARVAA
jgi:hypothetical protein